MTTCLPCQQLLWSSPYMWWLDSKIAFTFCYLHLRVVDDPFYQWNVAEVMGCHVQDYIIKYGFQGGNVCLSLSLFFSIIHSGESHLTSYEETQARSEKRRSPANNNWRMEACWLPWKPGSRASSHSWASDDGSQNLTAIQVMTLSQRTIQLSQSWILDP